MTIHTMKTTTFSEANHSQWKESAIQSLKGKPFESLITETIEGIELQPLYTKEDLTERRSHARSVKEQTGWIIAQETNASTASQFLESLNESIERGNEAILIEASTTIQWDEDSLFTLSQILKKYPLFLISSHADHSIVAVFDLIPQNERFLVKGAVSIANWKAPAGYSNLRTLGADIWDAHHKGADAVTELALALSLATQLADEASDFNEFVNHFFVRFAVDTHFFMEIAKFRAFRTLWNVFCSAYEQEDCKQVPLLATTSLRSYSKLDPYVNLLRAGNETFSAVLGGADVITVHPHDCLTTPSASSIRFARNIQLVIKEETHANKVVDAAGGSYFIETVTSELVDKAWNSFLSIEAAGGYDAFMQSGVLEKLVSKRQVQVATGEQSLIGTNVYADLLESNISNSNNLQQEGRLAEAFERIRQQFHTSQPKTVVLTFGELKDFKPRADFVTGFLATGGIRSEWSPAFLDVTSAMTWLTTTNPDYVIICASPQMTETLMDELLESCSSDAVIDVAGKYNAQTSQHWQGKGINGFMYAGQNRIEKLNDILNNWQGGQNK